MSGDDFTCKHCGVNFSDDTEVTAQWLMEHTGITEERLAAMPGGLEMLYGIPPELSILADLLADNGEDET